MSGYLEEFPPDTEGQVTEPLSIDEIMDIIYHSMPATWENKMIKLGFKYVDSTMKEMTDFFEIRVENFKCRKTRKNLLQSPRK